MYAVKRKVQRPQGIILTNYNMALKTYENSIKRYEEQLEKLKEIPCSLGAETVLREEIAYCKDQIEKITKEGLWKKTASHKGSLERFKIKKVSQCHLKI